MSIDPNQGQAFVQITIGQVYSEVTGMRQEVRDLMHSVQSMVGTSTDHEQRIRRIEQVMVTEQDLKELQAAWVVQNRTDGERFTSLEKWRWTAGGVVVTLSVGGGALVSHFLSR